MGYFGTMEQATCGSLMGRQHSAEARSMTVRASAAAVAMCGLLSLVCSPLLLALPVVLVAYFAAEAVFAVLYWYRYLLLSYQPIKHRPLIHDPIAALQRTLQHLQQDNADIRSFLSIWFHGAPISAIKRDNVKDLIAYAFWYKTPAEVAAEGRGDELEEQVATIESMWGLQLEPGFDPQLRCMCHLWEPMKHWYRPLAFYLAMEAAALLCRVALQAAGFQRHVWMGHGYYTKNMSAQHPHKAAYQSANLETAAGAVGVQQDVPLVLLHGIGMGLIPYISCLFNMAATGCPLLALELPHISQRWVLWVPTVDEVTEVLVSILNKNAISSCCLVGHSYGTAVASRLLQQAPQRIKQLCLIDPICFAMFMPNLLRNFLYESPNSGSWVGDFMMLSAARDLHVSATLSRRFFWSDVNLWEEQLPANTLVVLSGRDALMAAPQVRSWLEEHTQAVVMYHPSMVHAGFVMDISWQQTILQQLLQLLDHEAGKSCHTSIRLHDGDGQQTPHAPSVHSSYHTTGSSHSWSSTRGMQAPSCAGAASLGHADASSDGPCGDSLGATAQSSTAPHVGGAQKHPPRISSACSSCDDSQQSYLTCQGEDTVARHHGQHPAGVATLFGVEQECLVAATAASQPKVQASPYTSGFDRFSSILPSAANSARMGSLGSVNSSSLLLPQGSIRSREGSMELTSSLCMRSWSGVLLPTEASSTSAADTGLPESPRSCNTFVSASSVQSRRSLAASAAAQEATQAAHMLLQPLLAMQQQRQRQQEVQQEQAQLGVQQQPADSQPQAALQQNSLRRHTWDTHSSCVTGEVQGAAEPHAAAGVDCMVSYKSCTSGGFGKDRSDNSKDGGLPASTAAEATSGPAVAAHGKVGGKGLLGLRAPRASAGAVTSKPQGIKRAGVLKKVESLLHGRHMRKAASK